MILESSDIKNWDEFYEKLKNNLNPIIPDKLKGSIVRDKYSVVGFIDLRIRTKHKKDTRGKRLLKKKLKNKCPLTVWNSIVAIATASETKKISMAMYGRGSYPPPFWQVFPNEMDDLLTPKPVESSEHWIPRYRRIKFTQSNEFSKELIDFLAKPGKEIIMIGKNYYDKETGLKEGVTWLDDETPDMADTFAYHHFKNDFDIQPKTIAVVSYSRRMYDEFIEGYPDFLKPAFIQIYEPNQHKGRTFTDYHVLDCPSFLSNTAYDLKYYVRKPFLASEIYDFKGFRFLIKPKKNTPEPLY